MKVAKLDANGNVILGQDGKPIMIEIPDAAGEGATLLTADEAETRAQARGKKAYDEKKATEKMLADEKKAREDLEARLAARDKADKERQLQALPPDQQVVARMNDLEQQNARTQAELARVQAESAKQIRQVGLVAYRERALRDVPTEVHHLVFGETEEAIDQAVDFARQTYADLEAKLAQKFQGAAQQTHAHLQMQHAPHAPQFVQGYPQHPGQQPVQYMQPAAPPPNPAYVAPVPPQYAQAPNMFPTPTNPLPVADQAPGEIDLSEMTTEQAVRSGRYGGEMRERVHAALKGQLRYPGSLGSQPRHWSAGQQPANHVAQPNGVMQPQGFPTGPVQPAQMYQQPPPPPGHPYAPPPQVAPASPQGGARAAAAEAIARTHAGANPVMGGNTGAAEALQSAHQFAQQRGIQSPQQAFGQRFAPSPPIAPGSN